MNNNTIDNDDPRLTAYAMGELEGDARAEFEALLENDPAARAEVDAIRAFGGTLATEMQKAPCPALTDVQRVKVVRAAAPVTRPWFLRPEALAAAGLVGAIGLGLWSSRFQEQIVYTIEGTAGTADELAKRNAALYQDKSVELAAALGVTVEQLRDLNDDVKIDHFKTTILDPASTKIPEILSLDLWSNGPNGVNELDPNAPGGWSERAGLLVARGDLVGAIADCDRAIALDPNDARALALRSLARRALGDIEGAAKDADHALELNPDLPSFVRLNALTGPGDSPPPPDNPFKPAAADALSTFSIDVDTASYANVRRYLQQQSTLPPREAVRLEELINYFPYDYAQPTGEHPFAANVEVASCPWAREHRLVRVGLKGREQAAVDRPATNLVFLIDVSGSMSAVNKLPLVKRSLELLIEQLRPEDRVAIVVYAGASGVVLESTPGDRKAEISAALERLSAGGSTNGGAGIQLAYDIASRHFAESGGVNRVVLCTDGDWNVGVQSHDALQTLIAEKAKSNVFLSVLGFGMAHNDATLELLADKGNGNYAFVDTLAEARKVLVDQLSSTLVTIAKDVKIQVEWNKDAVESYRLIGYENRVLAARDFADDTKDAGEIGAGHTVTALYEVVPTARVIETEPRPLMTLRLRYKEPLGDVSRLLEQPAVDAGRTFDHASPDFRFAAGVAAFGLVLRDSPHKGSSTLALAHELTRDGVGKDPHGLRGELVELIKAAARIAKVSLTHVASTQAPTPHAPTRVVPSVTTESPVVLENLDLKARIQVSGQVPHLPDGTLLHISLMVDDREPPVEAGFFRVTVKGGRYGGAHEWQKKSFAPLAYRTEVRLIMEVQNPAVKRFLARELGYPAQHVERIQAVRTVLGSGEERSAFQVQTLKTLREFQQRAAALLTELQPSLQLAPTDPALAAFKDEFLPRLRQVSAELTTLEKTRVVWFDAGHFSALAQVLFQLDWALHKHAEGEERDLTTTEQDLRRILESIDSRLPSEPEH